MRASPKWGNCSTAAMSTIETNLKMKYPDFYLLIALVRSIKKQHLWSDDGVDKHFGGQ
jgi:hypothetical protein